MIPLKKPYPVFYKFLDTLLVPAMHLISGSLETPQETHNWNVQDIPLEKKDTFDASQGVTLQGTYKGFLGKRHGGILFHFPIIGGWKEYVVFEVKTNAHWHLGWFIDGMKKNYFQVSRLVLTDSKVRALKPPADTTTLFFALDESGNQIPLVKIGEGCVGDGSKFKDIRLL